jgi:TATA-box binding protein (TBP) (component of TFIID and TFIIIB)
MNNICLNRDKINKYIKKIKIIILNNTSWRHNNYSKIKKYLKKIKFLHNDINNFKNIELENENNNIENIEFENESNDIGKLEEKYIDLINVDENEINNLPEGIKISTMCASCKLNIKLNITNLENNLKLNSDNIIGKKINKQNIETLLPIKNKKKKNINTNILKNIKNRNYFYNQITIVMRVSSNSYEYLDKEPRINMKLFKNGSIQMSGCKSVHNINIALNKIINILNDSINTQYPYIDTTSETIKLSHFKMDMINSNYKIDIKIDRDKLHELLKKKKIRSAYEPCIKSCVIVKIPNVNNKDISIFIFQKGNIIINSAKSKEQIINSYNYINNILFTYKDDIIKKNFAEDENIFNKKKDLPLYNIYFRIYDDIMHDVKCGLIILDEEIEQSPNPQFNLKKKIYVKKSQLNN